MLVSGGRVRHDWILLLHFFESAATSGKPLRGVCQLECFYCGGLLCAGQATGGPVPVSAADFKESLIHGSARHCCSNSAWHGARRTRMNIHDQRATKPRLNAGKQPTELFCEPRAQRCLPSIRFHSKWRVEQLIRPSLSFSVVVWPQRSSVRRPVKAGRILFTLPCLL